MSIKEIVPVPELEDSAQFGYSQCVRAGNLVFLAGQCGLGDDHEIVSSDFAEQAQRPSNASRPRSRPPAARCPTS